MFWQNLGELRKLWTRKCSATVIGIICRLNHWMKPTGPRIHFFLQGNGESHWFVILQRKDAGRPHSVCSRYFWHQRVLEQNDWKIGGPFLPPHLLQGGSLFFFYSVSRSLIGVGEDRNLWNYMLHCLFMDCNMHHWLTICPFQWMTSAVGVHEKHQVIHMPRGWALQSPRIGLWEFTVEHK